MQRLRFLEHSCFPHKKWILFIYLYLSNSHQPIWDILLSNYGSCGYGTGSFRRAGTPGFEFLIVVLA